MPVPCSTCFAQTDDTLKRSPTGLKTYGDQKGQTQATKEKVIVGVCSPSNLLAQTDNTLKGSRHRLKNLPRSEGANPSDKRVKTLSLRGRAVSSVEMVKVQAHVALAKQMHCHSPRAKVSSRSATLGVSSSPMTVSRRPLVRLSLNLDTCLLPKQGH